MTNSSVIPFLIPILVFANHKGGTLKTTSVRQLLKHWALMFPGKHFLGVDLDPQGNLTTQLGGTLRGLNSTGDVLMRRSGINDAIQEVDHGIYLLATDIKLEDTSANIQSKSPNHMFLRSALRSLQNPTQWGAILIDCPPSADILVVNALAAADHLVVPLDPEDDAITGMMRIRELSTWLRGALDMPAVHYAGAIITKAGHTNHHKERIAKINSESSVLGEVPYRRGSDAEEQIAASYAPIAATLANIIGLE